MTEPVDQLLHHLESAEAPKPHQFEVPPPAGMTRYVITFSTVGLRDGWIEVDAYTEMIVRAWAYKEYRRWSDTTTLARFKEDMHLFPHGCLGRTTLYYEKAEHV